LITEFFIAIKPPTVTHQEKQVSVVKGKPIFYEPPELKAARAMLMAHLGKHVQKKYTGAVRNIQMVSGRRLNQIQITCRSF